MTGSREPALVAHDDDESSIKPPPYSVFSNRKKWFIITLAAYAGMFSPVRILSTFNKTDGG